MRISFFYCFVMFLFISAGMYAQNFRYEETTSPYNSFFQINDNAVHLSDYLPKNYVRDGTVDYTVYIQEAIDKNVDLLFPDFPLLINENGLYFKSNSNIYFSEKSILKLKPTSQGAYSIIKLFNVQNVNLYNLNILGDRKNHLGVSGEWGMGIRIQNSKNICIVNATIKDTWGDGIYINSYGVKSSENIIIRNSWIDNSRRNGISIISGSNITIDHVYVSNTNGVSPASGIDIEPNNLDNEVNNIRIIDSMTFNSQRDGLVLDVTRFLSKSRRKNVTLYVSNFTDIGSNYGLFFATLRNISSNDLNMFGHIKLDNIILDDCRSNTPLRVGTNISLLPDISISNFKSNVLSEEQFNLFLGKLSKDYKNIRNVGL